MINFLKNLFNNINDIKEKNEKQILNKKNVFGVGVSDNKIVVLVEKKEMLDDLDDNDIVPSSVEGYKTKVIEVGTITPSNVSGCPQGGTACSIGAICYKNNEAYYLQNSHCLKNSIGKNFLVPSPEDGGKAKDSKGYVAEQTIIKETGNKVDALIAKLDNQDVHSSIETTPAIANDTVHFTGRTSGKRVLKVLATNITLKINYPDMVAEFTNQIFLEGICRGGDSGSGLYKGDKLCGLIFASNNNNYAFANNISNVMEELGITFSKTVENKWKYFTLNENTGGMGTVADLKQELVDMLDKARGIAGIPFKINSGYRSPEYNEKVGGVKDSAHIVREAVDIRCRNSNEQYLIVNALLQAGFNRIGLGKTFIHCDISKTKTQNVIFDYDN